MLGSQPDRPFEEVSLNPALAPLLCAALLYTASWALGCSRESPASHPADGSQLAASESLRMARQRSDDKPVPAISGRKLTLEKTAQRAATSLQFSNPEFGIAFDAPKGYVLKEGDLPQMDRGLGYLGPIPMHFVAPGGVRLATVEAPEGVHPGTNFVNEFFTVSAHYESTAESCAALDIASESRGAVVTREVDSVAFTVSRSTSPPASTSTPGLTCTDTPTKPATKSATESRPSARRAQGISDASTPTSGS